ncbi:MAG: SPFH domain-containing protein [Bacteroidia bacterium]|nr:SPFH domain-containing protein [Bacteroidia bacterium]MCX7763463.1 SPFH domain-containing protein [Bacteroidia bacterium]MDW8058137.1 SPFH domain-containing protein [Bacteroidia bacterium]
MVFSFLRRQFIEIIEWVDETRNTLIWKFPDEDREIKMGAQLTVRESQVALLVNEGKIADVYPPGRHELTTRNMPILSDLRGWKYGFESPFKVDVYFVSTREFQNLRWGTPQPVMVEDPELSLVPLRAFGTFGMRVRDAATFFREFAGTDPVVTIEEFLEGGFRSLVVTHFSHALKRSGRSLVEINAQANQLGEVLLPLLQPEFQRMGVELTRFLVESVTLPEEIQQQLIEQDFELRRLRRKVGLSQQVEDMNKYLQFQAGQAMEHGDSGAAGLARSALELSLGMQMAQQLQQNNTASQKASAEERAQILQTLKELAELKSAGILTEEEFDAKKKELLSRL